MLARSSRLVLLCLASAGVAWGPGPRSSGGLHASSLAPAHAPAGVRQQGWFDARGRYIPSRHVTVKGHELQWLELSVHHASIQLAPLPPDTETILIDCGRSTITPDTLRVSCAGDAIGTLTITGTFLDKKGGFSHRLDEVLNEELLAATVTYKGPGGTESVPLRFSYRPFSGAS